MSMIVTMGKINLLDFRINSFMKGKKEEIPNDVVYYEYEKHWPHYGTGKWVVF
jgi:hypothetical protein